MAVGDDEVTKAAEPGQESQRTQVRRAAVASAIGTTIEWYDFFLYNTAAALVFPHLFFPASSAYAGAMQSFATYAVGFAARPVGAAIFGHWGDRIGRKATLIITLLVMGISSAVVGILPGTATIGVLAPLSLVFLRVIQGLAIGGEWSGSVLIAMEWGDQRKRGLLGSFAQLGVPMGLVLGTAVALVAVPFAVLSIGGTAASWSTSPTRSWSLLPPPCGSIPSTVTVPASRVR